MKMLRVTLLTVVALLVATQTIATAHEMTVQGTVVAVEATRLQIKTGKEKPGVSPAWYPIDSKTKIRRGAKTMTVAEAKIAVDERVVAIVDHPIKGPMTTKEIRLAAPKGARSHAQ